MDEYSTWIQEARSFFEAVPKLPGAWECGCVLNPPATPADVDAVDRTLGPRFAWDAQDCSSSTDFDTVAMIQAGVYWTSLPSAVPPVVRLQMNEKLATLQQLIASDHGESDLTPMADSDLAALQKSHPAIPPHLLDFYRVIGTGRVGSSRYMIHDLLPPSDIYDSDTSAALGSVLIVGDDFSGNCEGYDTTSSWTFGSIGSSGTFDPMDDQYPTIVDWLLFLLNDV